jgi:stress-induced morphogen
VKLGVVQPRGPNAIVGEMEAAVRAGIAGAEVKGEAGSPGHYRLTVTAEAFRGESRVNCQRMVLRCIAPLMKGNDAPVHAIDSIQTLLP